MTSPGVILREKFTSWLKVCPTIKEDKKKQILNIILLNKDFRIEIISGRHDLILANCPLCFKSSSPKDKNYLLKIYKNNSIISHVCICNKCNILIDHLNSWSNFINYSFIPSIKNMEYDLFYQEIMIQEYRQYIDDLKNIINYIPTMDK